MLYFDGWVYVAYNFLDFSFQYPFEFLISNFGRIRMFLRLTHVKDTYFIMFQTGKCWMLLILKSDLHSYELVYGFPFKYHIEF